MTTDSIRNKVRFDLLAGVRITPLYGVQSHKTVDLRKRLSELRQEGMCIDFEWEQNDTTGKRYKVHYMTKESIQNWKQQHKIQTT